MKRNTRKNLLRIACVCAALLILTGCGVVPNTSTTPEPAESSPSFTTNGITAAPDTEFIQKDRVVVGTPYLLSSLTPFRNTAGQRLTLLRYTYERLIYMRGDGSYAPLVAKNWEVADDGVTWIVEIFDNVYDAAGNHITTDDIIWFIEESMARKTKPCFSNVDSVTKLTDYSFEVKMQKDIAGLAEVMFESVFVISRKAFEESNDEFATKPVTTSPYVITEFVDSSYLIFTKRDDYWQDKEKIDPSLAANVNEIKLMVISEASQQQVALETGEVDAFPAVNATVVSHFEGNDNFILANALASTGSSLFFSGDPSRQIANDLNLRKAICYAINIDAIIDGTQGGNAVPMYDMIPRNSDGFQQEWLDEDYYNYDLEKAKACLAESSYNGEELILFSGSHDEKVCTIIQACCQQVGINVKINLLSSAQVGTVSLDGRQWDMTINTSGYGGANMWNAFLDANAYDYGDSMARKDSELNDLIHFAWENANYTPENINRVHRYLTDNAYIYGLYQPYTTSCICADLGVAETYFDSFSWLDLAACSYAEG